MAWPDSSVWICRTLSSTALSIIHTGVTDVQRHTRTWANSAGCHSLCYTPHIQWWYFNTFFRLLFVLLLIFGFRCQSLTSVEKGAVQFQMQEGSEERRSETWPGQGPFVGDLSFSSELIFQSRWEGIMCFSGVGGNTVWRPSFKSRSLEHQSLDQIYWSIFLITIRYRQIHTPSRLCLISVCVHHEMCQCVTVFSVQWSITGWK